MTNQPVRYTLSLVLDRLVAPPPDVEPTAVILGTLSEDGERALDGALEAWDLKFEGRDVSVIVQVGDQKPFACIETAPRSPMRLRILDAIRRCPGCLHIRTKRGKDAPRVWGSWRTQVCLDCGAFRMHAHDEDPGATPGWSKSAWRSAGEYDEAIAEPEDH